jgi:hypothetical protein
LKISAGLLVTTSVGWDQFCDRAATLMRAAIADKIRLEDLAAFFEKESPISDRDTRRYIESMVWEYGGSPRSYMQIVELFERKAAEEESVRILNSPEPGILARLKAWIARR